MSETGKTLLGTFGMTDRLMPLVLDDLSDADARRRARDGGGPSIAWTVGHLLHYRHYVLGLLGGDGTSPYGEVFVEDATGGADYPTVNELQSAWATLAPRFHEAIMSKSDDEWGRPGSGADPRSLRDQVTFLAWHEGYHVGALGALRKAMGYPGPAEKMMAARQAQQRA